MAVAKKALKLNFLQLGFKLTKKQEEYLEIMEDKKTRVVFLSGSAGTSKSFLCIYAYLRLLDKDARKKILYLRSPIESSEKSIGLLKGTLEEKTAAHVSVVYEKIEEILDKASGDSLKASKILSAEVVNFLRGKTFLDSYVVLDEASNSSLKEIKTTMTRLGKGSKIFVCGDPSQTDIKNSGFSKIFNVFDDQQSREKGIYCLKFEKSDIVRDPLIGYFLDKIELIE